MSKKRKGGHRPPPQGLTAKGTGKLVKAPASPIPPSGPVKEEISELDWLKWRVANQKEQGLIARKGKLETEQKAIQLEQDNLNLRIQLLRHENMRDIGHMDLGPKDRVVVEGNKYYIVRSPDSPALQKKIANLPPKKPEMKLLDDSESKEMEPEEETPEPKIETPEDPHEEVEDVEDGVEDDGDDGDGDENGGDGEEDEDK